MNETIANFDEINVIETSELQNNHIKVNLVVGEEHEGVWCLVDRKVKELYDSDAKTDEYYTGILDNDSICCTLNHGDTLIFRMNGKLRPLAYVEDCVEYMSRKEQAS